MFTKNWYLNCFFFSDSACFLRRQLLAGTVFSIRDTVTVGPVVVALDDEIFPAASAFLKLLSP
jgi:hypothetical protein